MLLIRRFLTTEKGALLLFILILFPLYWILWSLTLDGTENSYASLTAKRALNRAVKAAIIPIEQEQLAIGVYKINSVQSWRNFTELLQANLHLNEDLTPQDSSPLSEAPVVLDYFLCQGQEFPYSYSYQDENISFNYTFKEPGAAAVLKVKCKQAFSAREQVFYLYSAAEVKG